MILAIYPGKPGVNTLSLNVSFYSVFLKNRLSQRTIYSTLFVSRDILGGIKLFEITNVIRLQ